MNYVEVPLLLRYDVPATGGVKPFVLAGGAVSLKLTCDIDATSSGFSTTTTCEELETQSGSSTSFNTFDYGGVVGGGLAFDVSGKTFTVGARYNYSFGRIEKSSDTKHRVISGLVTLEMPWPK